MECIEQLKKIGLKEINTKTKIANKRLEDIFEFKFDELDRTRARGFIHILEREYRLDMSEWLNKYDEYQMQKEEMQKEQEETKETNKEIKEKVNISFIDTTIKDKTYIRLVVALAILVILFLLYFIYNNSFNNKEENTPSTQIQETIQEDTTALKESEEIETNIDSTVDNAESTANNVDSNATAVLNTSESDSNFETVDSNVEQNLNAESASSQINDTISLVETKKIANDLVITPKSPLWIGVISLQTYKKKQISISSKYVINLNESQIIRTGHGYFNIQAPNKFSKEYIGGDNKYFLYTKENGFKEITKDEFLSFNRGEEW